MNCSRSLNGGASLSLLNKCRGYVTASDMRARTCRNIPKIGLIVPKLGSPQIRESEGSC
jgi:hypothetical protein